MRNTAINLDEWTKAFEAAMTPLQATEGFSTVEIAESLGMTVKMARAHIKRMIQAGAAECAGRRRAFRMDGSPTMIPVYRLVGKQGAKK